MQRLLAVAIATTLFATTSSFGGNLPLIGRSISAATAQTATAQQPIVLKLSQSKKVADKKGFKLVPVSKVAPGETIVYTIAAKNISDRPIGKLVIEQKIRPGTTYVLNSATVISGANLTFSTDGGKTYTNSPTIDKKPAAASNYTNVRWTFTQKVSPKSQSTLSYEVRVR
jgi:uncharacterized repeat protein (TIGR01451 family)